VPTPDRSATLAIVPALDEEATVGAVVAACRSLGLDVVVVDDGSSDGTAAAARAAGAALIRLPVNIGVGGALRTGFRYAVDHGYRRTIQVDADLQHDPASIPALLAAADEGAHLVIGSRFAAGEYRVSRSRKAAMGLLASIVSRRVGVRLDDVTSGFRVISEPLLARFAVEYPSEYLGDTVEAILLANRSGARIAQVPVTMSPRTAGSATSSLHAAGHLARVLLAILARPGRRSAQ
jgi:glycosyltransferase involved in cell wall biosynthesis